MKNKISACLLSCFALLSLTGCYEDKGNYTYSELEDIEVTFPDKIVAMEGSEYLEFDPVVVSTINGTISADNSDYTYTCRLNKSWKDEFNQTHTWTDMNPEGTKKVKFFADVPAGSYYFWYTVTNKKTDVTFNFKGTCSVISTTSEGWMVLCNDGADKRVRLDLIFKDSKGVDRVRQDIFNADCPVLHNATAMTFSPSLDANPGDQMILQSYSDAYSLNKTTMQFTQNNCVKAYDFMDSSTEGNIIAWQPIFSAGSYGPLTRACVSDLGDAYGVFTSYSGNAFEFPMNTDEPGNPPTYKVAPFIGTGQSRPGKSNGALFYDKTNKRFMGWYYYNSGDAQKLLYPLRDPENAKFSFQTGMDMVYMEGTELNNIVWSVLQDASGKRYLYGIIVAGYSANFEQEGRFEVNAPDFDTADSYAFHSLAGLMFYSKGNKVYCYNIYTGRLLDTLTLDASEKVTKLKFNLYKAMVRENLRGWNDEFRDDQYRLIVASTTGQENGGIVRFYDIDYLNINSGKMTLNREYKGFGQEIVDVTYREQRR